MTGITIRQALGEVGERTGKIPQGGSVVPARAPTDGGGEIETITRQGLGVVKEPTGKIPPAGLAVLAQVLIAGGAEATHRGRSVDQVTALIGAGEANLDSCLQVISNQGERN